MKQALQWLLAHNIYYHANHVSLDMEALASPPQDGFLSNMLSISIAVSESSSETVDTDLGPSSEDICGDSHLCQSFVMTEQEAVRHSVEQRQSNQSLMWPSIGGTPINEFTTEGYFSCAFSTVFPTRAGDFSGQRQNQVTISNYFKHLIMYDDGRFATHPRFRSFALNTEMRWRARQTGRVYVKQHPGDSQLSLDELRDMVGREGEVFCNRVLHYGTSL